MVPREALAGSALLRDLEPEAEAAILRAARIQEFAAGAMVLLREDESRDVFFVLSGAVRVTAVVSGGRELIFTDHAAGEQFGELAAIDELPRSASVTALYSSRLLVMPGAAFRAALAASPRMTWRLLAQMSARIRGLSARFVEVALGSVRHRLVAELMRASRPRLGSEERIVSPPPRHHELAARIGVRREAVTRELKALERVGLVRQEPRGIVLARAVRLEDLKGAP